MARIPVYQQDRLASAVVGTPGVDKSPLMVAGALGEGTAALGSSQLRAEQDARQQLQQFQNAALQDLSYELRVMRYNQAQKEKAIADAETADAISHHGLQVKSALDDMATAVKLRHMEDPGGALMDLKDNSERILTEYLNQHPEVNNNPLLKHGVSKAFRENLMAQQKEMNDFRFTQATRNMKSRVDADAAALVNAAGQGGLETYIKKQGDIAGLEDRFKTAYGAEGVEKLKRAQKDAAKNFVQGLVNRGDLVEAQGLLSSTVFDGHLDEGDRSALEGHLSAATNAARIEADRVEHLRQEDVHMQILDLDDKLTLVGRDPVQASKLIGQMDAIIDREQRRPGGGDPGVVRAAVTAKKGFVREIEGAQREDIRDAKAAATDARREAREDAREAKQASRDKYYSEDGQQAREQMRALMMQLHEGVKKKKVDPALITAAREQLTAIKANGYAGLNGAVNDVHIGQGAFVRELIRAQAAKAEPVDWLRWTVPATAMPPFLNDGLNQAKSPEKQRFLADQYAQQVSRGLAAFRKTNNREPEAKDVKGIRESVATMMMLNPPAWQRGK